METKFHKHLGKGSEIEIEGEKYVLKPLSTEFIPDFFSAMKSFGSMDKESSTEDFMKNLSEDSIVSIKKLVDATLKKSFVEEWKANEEEVKEFGMKYMMVLLPKIFEINTVQNIEVEKKERIKKRLASDRTKGKDNEQNKKAD